MATLALIQPLAKHYLNEHPVAAAQALKYRSVEELTTLLNTQSESLSAGWLFYFSPTQAADILTKLDPEKSGKILGFMEIRAAAQIFSQWESPQQDEILQHLPQEYQGELKTLLSYSADRAGYFMNPRVLRFAPQTQVKHVLSHIRKEKKTFLGEIFIVDEAKKLLGVVSFQKLMLSTGQDSLDQIMDANPLVVFDYAKREEAIEIFEKSRLECLPVVDYEGRFLGVIPQSALAQAVEQEALSDLQTLVGAGSEERALSKVFFAVKKRLPWLHINLLTAFLAAAVVGIFEGTIAKFTALAVLLPVVAGQSGNGGAQALAVTLRGLALREVRTRQWMRIAFKEARVGLLNGLAIALTTGVGVLIWSRSLGLSLVIALAMVISMTAAGLAGALIPISLTALKQDPAQSGSIFLTTVTDIVGFLSFLGLATILGNFL